MSKFVCSAKNQLNPEFLEQANRVKELFFSRNPKYWSFLQTAEFKHIIDFRSKNFAPEQRLANYPNGAELYNRIVHTTHLNQELKDPQQSNNELLLFAAALSKDWENPASVENVVSMSSDPAIFGSMIGLLANPNLVYSESAGVASNLEKYVIRQIAQLVGYVPDKATGIFTQGGTFCNLYGYLLGIRKSIPASVHFGLNAEHHSYRIFNSEGGHYSNMTNLALLGVDIRETIRIKITENNNIDVVDFESNLRACFMMKAIVPTIMLTMGTTDTFGVDEVLPILTIRDKLCEEFAIKVKPHIHVDAAVGWPMIFFLDYDFVNNPLHINQQTLDGLARNRALFAQLKYADSFTVDFQKWGYVPYTSSLVMIKNKTDLEALANDPANFTYFERDLQGDTHLQSTIECSRGAVGMFGAYASLYYIGVQGYQTILVNCLQNANYFRERLKKLGFVKLIAEENQGPSVGFKIYNPAKIKKPETEFAYEYQYQNDVAYFERVKQNIEWHRQVFLAKGKVGLYTNWVESVINTTRDNRNHYLKLPGEKAVFMNPKTTRSEIDLFIDNLIAVVQST